MNLTILPQIFKAAPRLFILIMVLLVVNLGLFLFGVLYQQPNVEKLQNIWFEKRKAAARPEDPTAIYRQGAADLKLWRSKILPRKNFATFLGSLFETARNNSLTFSGGIAYKTVSFKSENLTGYNLDFTVSGKYAAIKSFISDIGRMPEMATIDTINLSGDATKDTVALKVTLTVYLKPEAS